jgi:hypothetical protein
LQARAHLCERLRASVTPISSTSAARTSNPVVSKSM